MRKHKNKFLSNVYFKNIIMMIILFITLYLPELLFRIIYNEKVSLLYWNSDSPNLFMYSYITLILGIIYLLPFKKRRIFFNVISTLEIIVILAQSIHFEVLGRIFGFSDLSNASEGSKYFLDSLKQFNPTMFYVIMLWIIYMILSNIIISKIKKVKFKHCNLITIIIIISVTLGFRFLADYKLGEYKQTDEYYLSIHYRYIYENYTDNTKSYYVSGLYEYIFRNIYITLKNKYNFDYEEAHNLINNFIKENKKELEENNKTNIFKDKNLIYIMVESFDTWILNEEYMPYTYKLSKEGINFTNRYAPQSGSGHTLNTEFALNTGLYPSRNTPAYNYVNNNFSNSLANHFKNNGYKVNSVHSNVGGYYNRTNLHNSYGYENHYDLEYMSTLSTNKDKFYFDLSLVKDDKMIDDMILKDEKFMTFFTTHSMHFPYIDNNHCNNTFGKNNYTEKVCLKYLTKSTDKAIQVIVENLKEKNILDDTVIVLASDHYMYGYENKEELYKIKETNNQNLLQNVPLIIWSSDIEGETNNTYLGTIDILPTILNMFGLEYNPNYYLGTDVYSRYHKNYIWFMDNTYYDGTYYNEKNIGDKKILEDISNKIKFNEYYLKSNYNNYIK